MDCKSGFMHQFAKHSLRLILGLLPHRIISETRRRKGCPTTFPFKDLGERGTKIMDMIRVKQ